MAMKILFLDGSIFSTTNPLFPGAESATVEKCRGEWQGLAAGANLLTFASSSARFDPGLSEAFGAAKGNLSCAYFQRAEDATNPELNFLNFESRGLGARTHLAPGSTIYSETFFQAGSVGERLDPAYKFAHQRLGGGASLDVWASFQSLLFLALRQLPEQGERGTGERVDAQLGADDKHFVYTVRCDLPPEQFALFRKHPILELARACAALLEIRYVRDAKKVEVSAIFPLSGTPKGCIEVHSLHEAAALDAAGSTKDYNYLTFGSLKEAAADGANVVKGGFRKKFSERVAPAAASPAPAPGAPVPEVAAAPVAPRVVVSGSASLGGSASAATSAATVELEKKLAVQMTEIAQLQTVIQKKDAVITELKAAALKAAGTAPVAAAAPDEWAAKVKSLEEQLSAKVAIVDKLSKELEETRDPAKRNVIAGIKDNAMEGMRQNLTQTIEKLQKELEVAQEREKEMLAVLDKAVQMKDEANKRIKEMETKLRTASGGNNSKQVQLEKQLEEQKRQNKEMSKKVAGLVDQITKAGLKPAA